MSTPLPDISAIAIEGTVYIPIIQDKFSYALWSDYQVWSDWVSAVDDPETYNVSQKDIDDAAKFSSFALGFACEAVESMDGCCLVSEFHGTLCVLRGNCRGTCMETYRLSPSQWEVMLDSFQDGQADYVSQLNSVGRMAGTDYMD